MNVKKCDRPGCGNVYAAGRGYGLEPPNQPGIERPFGFSHDLCSAACVILFLDDAKRRERIPKRESPF